MKRWVAVMVMMAVASGATQAATETIYSEDFSSAAIVEDPVADAGLLYYPDDFSAGQYATLNSAVALINVNGQLVVKSNENGGSRAVATVIDASSFLGPGVYTLSFDFVSAYNFAQLDVQVWNADGATAGNSFYVDVVGAQGATADISKPSASTVTLTPLSINNEYPNGPLEGTTQTIDFNYDGSGDVVLAFTAQDVRATGGFQQQLALDNITITFTPPPPVVRLMILDGTP